MLHAYPFLEISKVVLIAKLYSSGGKSKNFAVIWFA